MKHQIQNEAVQIMHYAGTRLNLEDAGGAVRKVRFKAYKITTIMLMLLSLFCGQYSFAQDAVLCANETVYQPTQSDSLCGRVVEFCIFCPQDKPSLGNYYYVCLPAGWQAVHGTIITTGVPMTCASGSNLWRLDRPTSYISLNKCFRFIAPSSAVISGGTFSIPLWRYVSSHSMLYTYSALNITLTNIYITSVGLSISPNPVCKGSPATITLSGSSGGANSTHFTSTPAATITGSGTSFTFTASTTGIHNIVYENMDNCEYGTTTVNVIDVPNTPVINTTAVNNCNPFTVCIVTVQSGVTYTWNVTNGTFTGSTPCITVTATSTSSPTTVTVTATNSCGSVTSNTLTIAPCEPPRCDASVSYNQIGDYILGPGTYTWTPTSNPWGTNPVRINGNLIIKSNATLNLRNITLEFSPRSKIVVEDTARLDMRANTVLKAVGTCMWLGVENISSTNAGIPGLVYMRNSTIRDAITAISLGQKDGGLVQYSAGLVDIRNSTFLNNHIGIHYKANLSYAYLTRPGALPLHSVQNTLFRCDSSLKLVFDLTNNPSNRSLYFQKIDVPVVSLTKFEFDNISISNQYQNLATPSSPVGSGFVSNQTKAIYSLARLRVGSCSFVNTQYGVQVISNPLGTFSNYVSIGNNTFNYNTRGIMLFGVQGIVRLNTMLNGISNPVPMPTAVAPYGIGIYADGTGALTIRENTINGFDMGAVVDNGSTTGFATEIIGNTFNNNYMYCLGTGGNNMNAQVACNNFNGYFTSASIPPRIGAWYVYDYASVQARMADQGNLSTPAGNRFNVLTPSDYDIYVNTSVTTFPLFSYFHSFGPVFTPFPYSTLEVDAIGITASSTTYCNSLLGPPIAAYPRASGAILAQLATATSRQDSLSLYTELYFRYLENQDTAGVRTVLQTQNTLNAKRALVEYYLTVGKVPQANALLSTLPSVTPDDVIFKQYYTMQANHVLANRPCHTIDSTQENTVRAWRGQRGNLMGVLMSSLHRNCGDSVWVDCQMLGLCSGSSSRYAQQNTDVLEEQKPNTAYLGDAYPNPVQDVVHIPYQLGKESGTIDIYNIFGVKVHTYSVSEGYGVLTIPVSDLPKGMYIYTLTTQQIERVSTKKFMVQ